MEQDKKSRYTNPWVENTEKENQQNPSLFDKEEFTKWNEEWQNMPEYISRSLKPFHELIVRFSNEDDLKKFAELMEQNVNKSTKSIWYPKMIVSIDSRSIKNEVRYVDETSNELEDNQLSLF